MTDVSMTSVVSEGRLSAKLPADELDFLTASLRESVVSAVAEIVPAQMGDLMHSVQRALSILETISPATASPSLPAQEGELSKQSQNDGQIEESERSNKSPPNTLEQVSDQLFHEILIGKPLASSKSHSGDDEASVRRSNSGRSSMSNRSLSMPRGLPSSSSPRGSGHKGHSKGKANFVCPRLEEGSPEDCDNSRAPSAIRPTSSRRVAPYESQDHFDEILAMNRGQQPKTLKAVDTSLQETIIRKACSIAAKLEVHHAVLGRCILKRGVACRMGLFLTVLLCAAVHVVGTIQNFATINPLWDLTALIFVIAAGFSSKHFFQGQQHIEHMTGWAETHACDESWRIISWRRQRRLLAWWVLTLLCVLLGGAGISYQLLKLKPREDMWIVFLWAREGMILTIFVVSSCLLFLAAFIQCHIISALDVFIDVWSCDLCEHRNFAEGVVSWNTVQALIRRAGISFENIFTIIQTSALLGCIVVANQAIRFALHPEWSWDGLVDLTCILPLLLLSALAGSLLVQSSSITEKCSLLAPLVNQIMSDDAMDAGRHYLVRFLTDSAAGIYVKAVRMDMQMVMNIVYFLAVAASGIFGLAKAFRQASW